MTDAADVVADDEVVLTPEQQAAEDAADAEFESGFAQTPTETTPPADDEAAKLAADAAAVTEKAAADKAAADAVVAPVVKYRQVTETEWNELQAKAAEIDTSRKKLDQAFGKMGGIERTLATLQSATPAGHAVEVTDDMVADLTQEYPEIGGMVLKSLQNLAGKLKGTSASASVDPQQVEAVATRLLVAVQTEALEDDYPNWREIVGDRDSKNEYRQWLATQPAEYQQKLVSTNSASVISKSITKFTAANAEAQAAADKAAAAKAAADKAAAALAAKGTARREQLAAAAQPKGAGGHVAADTEDDFEAGFASGPAGRKVS